MTPEAIIIQSMYQIVNKAGHDVPFILNPAQRSFDRTLAKRNLVVKARQLGFSRYILARFSVCCMTQRNVRATVISHERESTERLLAQVHYYIENLRGPKPVIENASKNEITFPKTGSMFYIGTAGSKAFGRGDTITHFHGSEVAQWENPKELLAGALQAVPLQTGEVFLESTGNGAGTWFHRTALDASRGRNPYKLHFHNWIDFPEYDLAITAAQAADVLGNLQEELGEPELLEVHKLTAGQLMFRRIKLAEMDWDVDLFKQEYPITLDEAFRASGAGYFHKITYRPSAAWKRKAQNYWGLEYHPREGLHYILGCDSAAGVNRDSSVMEVVCVETNEQVAEFSSAKISPDVLATRVAEVGKEYRGAYVVVESNNHGAVVLDNLSKLYPRERIHKDRKQNNSLVNLGYRTSVRSKPFICGLLKKSLAQGLIIHSDMLHGELTTFVEDDNGKLGAQDGCHDDCVMALAMANVGMPRALIIAAADEALVRPTTGFTFEEIESAMNARHLHFPIPPQHTTDIFYGVDSW